METAFKFEGFRKFILPVDNPHSDHTNKRRKKYIKPHLLEDLEANERRLFKIGIKVTKLRQENAMSDLFFVKSDCEVSSKLPKDRVSTRFQLEKYTYNEVAFLIFERR